MRGIGLLFLVQSRMHMLRLHLEPSDPRPVFSLRRVLMTDATALYALEEFHAKAKSQGTTPLLSGVNPRVRSVFRKFGFEAVIGPHKCSTTSTRRSRERAAMSSDRPARSSGGYHVIVEEPPPIIHTPLPLHAIQLPVLFIMTVLGIGMGGYVAASGISGGSPLFGTLLGIAACGAVIGLGVLYNRSLRRRTTPHVPRDRDVEYTDFAFVPEVRHAAARLIELPWRERRVDCANAWSGFVSECKRLGLKPPRTIVHTGLAKRLDAVERPSHGMEPEAILCSGDMTIHGTWLFVAGMVAAGAVFLWSWQWFAAAMMFISSGIIAIGSIPALRDRFRIMRWDEGKLVAGMGALKDVEHDRLWTVIDAVMIVRTKEPVGALFVRFVGEAGTQRLTFVDERDPDFVKLWQRWNHPQPRPELMAN